MQQRKLNFEPQAVPTAAGNLFNCGLTSLAGPVGFTATQPYVLVSHIRLTNRTGAAIAGVTLYKGATGASVANTEYAFANVSVPANGSLDWYAGAGGARFDSTDFLVGVAAAAGIVATLEGEIGFA